MSLGNYDIYMEVQLGTRCTLVWGIKFRAEAQQSSPVWCSIINIPALAETTSHVGAGYNVCRTEFRQPWLGLCVGVGLCQQNRCSHYGTSTLVNLKAYDRALDSLWPLSEIDNIKHVRHMRTRS
jgi:hypothetical protein